MRRFWLLLLVLVLPLQMSWAATHFCDDERLVAKTVVAAELGNHAHQALADEVSDSQAEKIADACCGTVHGCHGLHHLVGLTAPVFVPARSTQMPIHIGAAPPAGELLSRVERPKWSAA